MVISLDPGRVTLPFVNGHPRIGLLRLDHASTTFNLANKLLEDYEVNVISIVSTEPDVSAEELSLG